jgi:transcriptional regulator of acetoin/glycerol metabolism
MVQSFIEENAGKGTKKISGLTPEALEALLVYAWPGNVRELRNAIEYAFVLCRGGWIGLEHLPPKIASSDKTPAANHKVNTASFQEQRKTLIDTLRQVGGNQSEAARVLGVSRVTIWKRIKKYGIKLDTEVDHT